MDPESLSSSENIDGALTIPKNQKKLKACSNCGLLLNETQWDDLQESCPNKCESRPTKNFEGVISIMKPSRSWAVKRIGVRKQDVVPGIYAIEIFDN